MIRNFCLKMAAFCLAAAPLHALDRYMTKTGAGAKTGVDWSNAYACTTANLTTVLNTHMAPGDTLYLEGADYPGVYVTITTSGTATQRKSLIGVDRGAGLPLLRGTEYVRSYTSVRINGSSYWTIQNIDVEHNNGGFAATGPCLGLIFDGLSAYNIDAYGFSFSDCDNLQVLNCKAERYNRRGFAFLHSCDGVTIKNCYADFTGTGMVADPAWRAGGNDPIGFHFHLKNSTNPFNTNILMEDCETLNNDEDTTTVGDYEQGDGYMFEGRNDGVTLKRCISYRNQDGAYDMKGSNQVLTDCVAMTSRNGFKLWYSGNLTNCISLGNWAFQIQVAGNTTGNVITANHCTLHCISNTHFGVSVELAGNTLLLNDCIISFAGAAGNYRVGAGTTTYNGTVTHANASNTANAPRYVAPTIPWSGHGTNFDNLTYGLTKGWNSTVIGGNVVTVNPEADTHVYDASPTSNYGSDTSLEVKDVVATGFDRISYVRFPLSGVSSVTSATLKLQVTAVGAEAAGPRTVQIRELTSDTWSETTTNWGNRPASSGALIGTIDAQTVGQVYTVDVTSYVNAQLADGKASFVLIQPSGVGRLVEFGSRESSTAKPLLEIQ